jgi:hypothetical protein
MKPNHAVDSDASNSAAQVTPRAVGQINNLFSSKLEISYERL